MPAFPADAFSGTAEYYLRYRPAYPGALIEDLIARTKMEGRGRLLDLACGPGRVTLRLAPSFAEVVAVDLEPQMIAVGQTEAKRLGLTNVAWSVGRAEDVAAPKESFDLIIIGDAFHRLDQTTVIEHARTWLKPHAPIAILGSHDLLSGSEEWHAIVKAVVGRWTQRPPVYIPATQTGPEYCERLLTRAGFVDVSSFAFAMPYVWTSPDIIGHLYSTSFCSKAALGANVARFTADLEDALLRHDTCGVFPEILRFGYTFGRRAGSGAAPGG